MASPGRPERVSSRSPGTQTAGRYGPPPPSRRSRRTWRTAARTLTAAPRATIPAPIQTDAPSDGCGPGPDGGQLVEEQAEPGDHEPEPHEGQPGPHPGEQGPLGRQRHPRVVKGRWPHSVLRPVGAGRFEGPVRAARRVLEVPTDGLQGRLLLLDLGLGPDPEPAEHRQRRAPALDRVLEQNSPTTSGRIANRRSTSRARAAPVAAMVAALASRVRWMSHSASSSRSRRSRAAGPA